MRLKPGVRIRDKGVAAAFAFAAVDRVYREHGVVAVMTSANDSKHGFGSLHFQDAAWDFRTKNLPNNEAKLAVQDEVAKSLGNDFDVILEGLGTDNEHLHIEFQPKVA